MAAGRLLAGRYRLVGELARGGMAEVWHGVDELLGRPVAVKVLLPHLSADPAFVARFRHESQAAARLSNTNVVTVYDTCHDGDVEAIVMELVQGTDLRARLDERGPLPTDEAAGIGAQVASALDHAHSKGLVHRDIKPANILLCDDGRVVVTDFGIAKATESDQDLTEVGQVVGTAKYLSPEQVSGKPVDGRSDVYSLGVVLYEAACGQPPFSGSGTATAGARLTSPAPSLRQRQPDVAPWFEAVVERAMALEPDARYPTALALRRALLERDPGPDPTAVAPRVAGPLDGRPVTRTGVTPAVRPATPRHRRAARRPDWWPTVLNVTAVVAILVLVIGVLARTEMGRDLLERAGIDETTATSTPAGDPVAVARASSFDPFGDGVEHPRETTALIDDDPSSTWSTEDYRSPLDQIKQAGDASAGVGAVLVLAERSRLGQLVVDSADRGWSASVYVADDPSAVDADDLAPWGRPVATFEVADDRTTVDLTGTQGAILLVWITDLGRVPEATASVSVSIAELDVLD